MDLMLLLQCIPEDKFTQEMSLEMMNCMCGQADSCNRMYTGFMQIWAVQYTLTGDANSGKSNLSVRCISILPVLLSRKPLETL